MTRVRRSARVLLRDPDGRVFLLKYTVARPRGPVTFWATPGGEVEHGESDLEAAARELNEELGLSLELSGPVHTEISTATHDDTPLEHVQIYFHGRCAVSAPRPRAFTALEADILQGGRWWSVEEIETTAERLLPKTLVAIVRGLPAGR